MLDLQASRSATRVAAIDIGTNSVLLLVAERRDGDARCPVLERARITRLGRGVDATRALDPEAAEATLACLADYAAIFRARARSGSRWWAPARCATPGGARASRARPSAARRRAARDLRRRGGRAHVRGRARRAPRRRARDGVRPRRRQHRAHPWGEARGGPSGEPRHRERALDGAAPALRPPAPRPSSTPSAPTRAAPSSVQAKASAAQDPRPGGRRRDGDHARGLRPAAWRLTTRPASTAFASPRRRSRGRRRSSPRCRWPRRRSLAAIDPKRADVIVGRRRARRGDPRLGRSRRARRRRIAACAGGWRGASRHPDDAPGHASVRPHNGGCPRWATQVEELVSAGIRRPADAGVRTSRIVSRSRVGRVMNGSAMPRGAMLRAFYLTHLGALTRVRAPGASSPFSRGVCSTTGTSPASSTPALSIVSRSPVPASLSGSSLRETGAGSRCVKEVSQAFFGNERLGLPVSPRIDEVGAGGAGLRRRRGRRFTEPCLGEAARGFTGRAPASLHEGGAGGLDLGGRSGRFGQEQGAAGDGQRRRYASSFGDPVQGGRQGRVPGSGCRRGHPHRGEGHRRQPSAVLRSPHPGYRPEDYRPRRNASAVGLRQVISEQEIREIFDILRERTIAFDNQTWNRRYRGFMDKIKTGSIYDVAEVLRDLYRLKTDKQLSFGERRMLDTARALIVKEIAIARKQTEEQVRTGDRGHLSWPTERRWVPRWDPAVSRTSVSTRPRSGFLLPRRSASRRAGSGAARAHLDGRERR